MTGQLPPAGRPGLEPVVTGRLSSAGRPGVEAAVTGQLPPAGRPGRLPLAGRPGRESVDRFGRAAAVTGHLPPAGRPGRERALAGSPFPAGRPHQEPSPVTSRWAPAVAVLFDRDGTLVEDVPYNGDPDLVRLRPGAREAVGLLRARGVPTAVVSNQSGIGRGLLTHQAVRQVNARADALLGGVDAWLYCPHLPGAGCDCRKPAPGLVLEAADRLGVPADRCVLIGDIAADVLAARAAGAHGILVPNAATRPEEVAAAPDTAEDLLTAVHAALAPERGDRP